MSRQFLSLFPFLLSSVRHDKNRTNLVFRKKVSNLLSFTS